MKSKEEQVIEPFFNSPKHWHFEELCKIIKISRPQLSYWLRRYEKEGMIQRTKPKNKMPYYSCVFDNPSFRHKKRLFALKQLTESGLFSYLSSLSAAKVIILFGSFSRYDWYDTSDIDIFIYGEETKLQLEPYKRILNREIQVHLAKDKDGLNQMDKMIPYIISGDFIKGSIEDLDVNITKIG